MPTVVIGDDHPIVRAGLRRLLLNTTFTVVGEATTARDALEQSRALEPDLLVLDVCMPDLDGVTALGRIKAELPDLRVLMLSTYDNPAFVARAVAFGAGGYVLKTLGRDQLLEAMLSVSAGKDLWTQTDMRRISGALGTPRIRNLVEAPLTAREAEVLECVSRGLTNKEIAHELGISNETVKEHVQHTLSKLGLSDRTQAAVWAIRNGVVA